MACRVRGRRFRENSPEDQEFAEIMQLRARLVFIGGQHSTSTVTMNTNIRSAVSTSIALGLVSFTVTSALVSSVAAPATLVAFGLLAVYGMIEITLVSYEGPHFIAPSEPAGAQLAAPSRTVIQFPVTARQGLARAA